MKYLIPLILIFTTNLAWSQNHPKTVFETELSTDAPKTDEYAIAQEYILDMLTRLKSLRTELAKGDVSSFELKNVAQDFYKLYASGFLMCSIKNGVCKEFLDTILEIDLINSKVSGKVACLTTLKMWKAWLDNDMEKRHSHQTKITHVNEVSKFNKEERPRYHRCSKTIEGLIADSTVTPAEFFKARYSGGLVTDDYVQKTLDFFTLVKEKKVDIYAEIGME